ncbi:MAG: hypothetical protein D6706_07570 [Chloroflexi bacterium]|nr:MAG: hypothetical protein D6706_07570 [Chloroflexota bacterium]
MEAVIEVDQTKWTITRQRALVSNRPHGLRTRFWFNEHSQISLAVIKEETTMNKVMKQYTREFLLAMGLYAILVFGTSYIIHQMENSIWRYPIAILPVLPMILGVVAYLRLLNRIDELQQKIHLNAISLAAGATGIITFTIGFLQTVGFPDLSWIFIFPLLIALWGISILIFTLRYS